MSNAKLVAPRRGAAAPSPCKTSTLEYARLFVNVSDVMAGRRSWLGARTTVSITPSAFRVPKDVAGGNRAEKYQD